MLLYTSISVPPLRWLPLYISVSGPLLGCVFQWLLAALPALLRKKGTISYWALASAATSAQPKTVLESPRPMFAIFLRDCGSSVAALVPYIQHESRLNPKGTLQWGSCELWSLLWALEVLSVLC